MPSWTETLIACGAHVVARTRFCIHPKNSGAKIIGGTKSVDWDKLKESGADILILDKEENPKSFADESAIPFHTTHIVSVSDVAPALRDMAALFKSEPEVEENLCALAKRWDAVANRTVAKRQSWQELPGVIEWIKEPKKLESSSQFAYVIWRDPWMVAAPQTFIGSMLGAVGFGSYQKTELEKYPKISLEDLNPETVLLFSSEPYPFEKKREELLALPFASALVDGESYSWFGLRALRFLEGVK